MQQIPFDLSPVIEDVCHDFVVSCRLGEPFHRRSDRPLVYMVTRDRFDYYLAEQAARAGSVLLDRAAVTSLTVGASEVEVRTSTGVFRGAALVGADGANSVVARRLGLGRGFHYWVAWESEIDPGEAAHQHWQGLIGIDLGTIGAGGYGWVFPKREHLSVGTGAHERGAREIKGYYAGFAARHGLADAAVLQQRGHRLPLRPPDSPIWSGRALLAGDAAGLVDGFTGEGIYWAVRSGKLAAVAVLELLRGQTGDLASYERRIDAELMPELLTARRWLNLYLWAPTVCYQFLRASDHLWQAFCENVRGERGYQDRVKSVWPLRLLTSLLPVAASGTRGRGQGAHLAQS